MLLGNVDTCVWTAIAIRYPTLRIHVRHRQLFGLHDWRRRADALTGCLPTNFIVLRIVRFGASTAKIRLGAGLWISGQFELRSNWPACRGQRVALPTARASAHFPTALHHGD